MVVNSIGHQMIKLSWRRLEGIKRGNFVLMRHPVLNNIPFNFIELVAFRQIIYGKWSAGYLHQVKVMHSKASASWNTQMRIHWCTSRALWKTKHSVEFPSQMIFSLFNLLQLTASSIAHWEVLTQQKTIDRSMAPTMTNDWVRLNVPKSALAGSYIKSFCFTEFRTRKWTKKSPAFFSYQSPSILDLGALSIILTIEWNWRHRFIYYYLLAPPRILLIQSPGQASPPLIV